MTEKVRQWFWIMKYCKLNNLPPAQHWAWQKGKQAYKKRYANVNHNEGAEDTVSIYQDGYPILEDVKDLQQLFDAVNSKKES